MKAEITHHEESLARRIKEQRLALGLSQVKLAYRLGCTPTTVARWEQGRRVPSRRLWLKVKRVLGLGGPGGAPES